MQINNKKFIAVLLCSIFLISIFNPATAINMKKESIPSDEINEDTVETNIEKIEDLLENYMKMEDYISLIENDENESAFNKYENAWVVSWGRGFHYKSRFRIKIVLTNRLLELLYPWNRPQFNRPWVFCSHKNDSKSKTFILKAKDTDGIVKINGSHIVLMHRFVGFTTWPGKYELSPLDIFPKLVIGRAKAVYTLKV
jgi:hypothetical protein